jgi:hydrogenase maturation protease
VIRIIGIGNSHRTDDAAGVAVARLLRDRKPAHAEIIECEDDPTRLLDRWAEGDRVIVVDAAAPSDRPGRVYRFDALAAPLPAELFRLSSHAVGLGEVVELGRALGRLPRSLVVYAVEGADFATGQGLSPAVERALRGVAERVLREAAELGD